MDIALTHDGDLSGRLRCDVVGSTGRGYPRSRNWCAPFWNMVIPTLILIRNFSTTSVHYTPSPTMSSIPFGIFPMSSFSR